MSDETNIGTAKILGDVYFDGEYLPSDRAVVPVQHWGLRRADAVYDTVSVVGNNFFNLDAHLSRFQTSLNLFKLSPPESMKEIEEIAHRLARNSGAADCMITFDCLRGVSVPGKPANAAFAPSYLIGYAVPYYHIVPPIAVERGAHMIISSVMRIPAASVDPRAKNYHRGDMTRATFEAVEVGADQPILLDLNGNVTEGPGFNVFAVIGGEVVTPDAGVLEGVTRGACLELCQKLGIPSAARPLPVEELRQAEELFLTSTAGGIMAITRLDGRIYTNDRPGEITSRLQEQYWTLRREGWHSVPVK